MNRPTSQSALITWFRLLGRDKFACASLIVLVVAALCALLGPWLAADTAQSIDLRMRNHPPFDFSLDARYVLGTDALGRSVLARLIVASGNTLFIAALAVALSLISGCTLGLIAGSHEGRLSFAILRLADMIMSFPSLLLAVVVLYVFEPGVTNVVAVLAITRMPVYIRTVRAEVLEIRQRMYVVASEVMGAAFFYRIRRHIIPALIPTLCTVATLEFAAMMLTEAGLSFLGLGIQPPEISWGLLVAEGRGYLSNAWWIAFWPGLAIMLVTTALNLFSSWLRVMSDPRQRWRLEMQEKNSHE